MTRRKQRDAKSLAALQQALDLTFTAFSGRLDAYGLEVT